MTSYHKDFIPNGKLGEISKVIEEALEYRDFERQSNKIGCMVELSDIYGALEATAEKYNLTMEDLAAMAKCTKRVFESGGRSSKQPFQLVHSVTQSVIEYQILAHAIEIYKKQGFIQVEVPWIVSVDAKRITHNGPTPYELITDQSLVGSAEQSFVQLIMSEENLSPNTKFMSVSPCFRYEPHVDFYHSNQFIKLELFVYMPKDDLFSLWHHVYREDLVPSNLKNSITFVNTSKLTSDPSIEAAYDLEINNIEVGSAYVRSFTHKGMSHRYFCATGLALPRFSQVISKDPYLLDPIQYKL